MKRVKFLQDYRGELTLEYFYQRDEEADFPEEVADALVDAKRAAHVKGTAAQGEVKPAVNVKYTGGKVTDFPKEVADALVDAKRAEYVEKTRGEVVGTDDTTVDAFYPAYVGYTGDAGTDFPEETVTPVEAKPAMDVKPANVWGTQTEQKPRTKRGKEL